jgi:hypothetical protein
MMKGLLFVAVLSLFLLACNSQPGTSDIKKKILLEYICAETAQVNNLRILSTKDAESIFGTNKGYEYLVSGEIEWPGGCKEFGSGIPPGSKEVFDNKKVFLIKGNDGVWR